MARLTPWKDEYTLLCEKCGYVLEGLDQAGVCPECGKPIEESLPERRVGTPWQQEPGFKSLVRTWWMTLRHPKRMLDVMSLVGNSGFRYCLYTLLFSTGIGIGLIVPLYWIEDGLNLQIALLAVGILATLYFAASLSFLIFYAKTMRSHARRFERRIPYDTSWHITALVAPYSTALSVGISGTFWHNTIEQLTKDSIYLISGIHLPPTVADIALGSFYIVIFIIPLVAYFVAGPVAANRFRYTNRVRPQEPLPNEPRP